ncbi:hypothetical protein ACFLXI_02795 [Chloroflexota bacterium]
MRNRLTKNRSPIRRYNADKYILTSLVGFAATVIITRVFLQLTGFPQLGNSVLHFAHALWGGLLLIVVALLPLAFNNRWALQASAVLGGIGIGLFMDEVGKFITQANDYFFPPALPLIYGFILLIVLVYLYFRRPPEEDARVAMYHALEGLKDLLDGDLDVAEANQIKAQFAVASRSDRAEIVSLANILHNYLLEEDDHLPVAKADFLKRARFQIGKVGKRLGRHWHRIVISMILVGWLVLVVGYIAAIFLGVGNLDPQVYQLRYLLIGLQIVIGLLIGIATYNWLRREEERALKFGLSGVLFSLVALQLLYFYISQFAALTATLLQLVILLVFLAYRRWYLE